MILLKLVRCPKCGTAIMGEQQFLQNIVDAMETENRRARNAKAYPVKRFHEHQAADYKQLFRSFTHHLTEKDRLRNESAPRYTALKTYVLSKGLMTAEELETVIKAADVKTAARLREEDKILNRLYGSFDTISNRTQPDPTARAAIQNIQGRKNHT